MKMFLLVASGFISVFFSASAQTWEQITPALSLSYPRIACSADGVTLLLWENVTNVPALNLSNLQYEVALPLADQSFYRLKSQ